MQTVTCVHCGYILAGLPAKSCADCGHLYLQCPECGKTQEANAAGIALVQSIQRIIGWVPRIVQGIDITLLVIAGTLTVLLGCILGISISPQIEVTAFACVCIVMAVLVDVVVLRFRNRWRGHLATVGILAGATLVGALLALLLGRSASGWTEPAQCYGWLLLAILAGTLLSRYVAGTLLLLLFKKSDRQWIIARHQTAMREGRWRKPSATAEQQVSLFCIHCRGAMPPATPHLCPACQLAYTGCPTCGESTPISGSIPAVEAAADVGRSAWLMALAGVRLLLVIWTLRTAAMFLATALDRWIPGSLPSWASLRWDLDVILAVPALTCLVTLAVFAGRKPIAAVLGVWAVTLFTAGMFCATNYRFEFNPAEAWRRMPIATLEILLLQLLAVILATMMRLIAKAILPKRQMAEIDDLTPLPRASASSSAPSAPRLA